MIVKEVQIPESILKAESVTFDNSNVDMESANTQSAIVEVLSRLKSATLDLQNLVDAAYYNSNQYTDQKISGLINGAPSTLDTLKEIADAMAESADVVAALDVAIGTKANAAEFNSHVGNKNNPHGVTAAQIGLGNVNNTADSAKSVNYANSAGKLASAKTLQTDLASESAVGFDGSVNKTVGVTGTLPIKHGGTGQTTRDGLMKQVIFNGFCSSPSAVLCSDSSYTNMGATTLSALATAMGLNKVNNTPDSDKSVKYAASADYANSAGSAGKLTAVTVTTDAQVDSFNTDGLSMIYLNASSSASIILHIQPFTTFAWQIWFSAANRLYFRVKLSGKWGEWYTAHNW